MLQDALRNALKGNDLKARATGSAPEAAPEPRGPGLPHPSDSEWGRLLGNVPADASIGRYQQESAAKEKAWKKSGRKREAKALTAARTKFMKTYEKAAWKAVKERWTALSYPERLYRRLKSDRIAPGPVAERLHTRRAEQMKAEGTDALWTWVTTGKRS